MSPLICIGSSEHIDFIRNKLEIYSKLLQAEGVVIRIEEESFGGYTFWDLEIPQDAFSYSEGTLFSLRYSLAKLVTDLILTVYERRLLKRALKCQYYYFNQNEQDLILAKSQEILAERSSAGRKNAVFQAVFEYLETEKLLIMDGFVRFRLKKYLDELNEVVEQAVDEYFAEKEYNDFLRLLKYFVDIQEPRVDRVHVLLQSTGFFQLFDGQDNMIKSDYLESFILELSDHELNYEDLLISTLITLAPRRIILHVIDAGAVAGTVSTIETIFAERVFLCSGCSKCANAKQHQKKP